MVSSLLRRLLSLRDICLVPSGAGLCLELRQHLGSVGLGIGLVALSR
jgi:hypothetical protein